MKLSDLLKNIYPDDDARFTHSLLEHHDLILVLQIALDRICHFNNSQGDLQENQITNNIGALASSFLTGVNSKLSLVPVSDEKAKIELIISDVAFELIKSVLDNYRGDRRLLLSAINYSLQTTCEFNGYDFNALSHIMPLKKYIELQPDRSQLKIIYKGDCIYYKWNSGAYNLSDLCSELKARNVIKSTKEFYKLFESPKEDFIISFNREYHDELIVLFDILYHKKHILPVGNKGHFLPLQRYAVDFENKSLLKKEAKTLKYTLKKNKVKWQELNEKVYKWIAGFR